MGDTPIKPYEINSVPKCASSRKRDHHTAVDAESATVCGLGLRLLWRAGLLTVR